LRGKSRSPNISFDIGHPRNVGEGESIVKITSSRPHAGKPQDLLRTLDQTDNAEVEIDEATDGGDLASLIETMPPEQQVVVVKQTAKLFAQLPLAAQQSTTGWFEPSARNAMVVGGVGGLGVGALLAGLRATNNPYLVVAGTIASGIATGYVLHGLPKKRVNVKGKASGWLGSLEFDLAAETDQTPTK